MQVMNGSRMRLVIANVHEGPAGVQEATEGERARFGAELVAAYRSTGATRRPQVGDAATLDGEAFELVGTEASRSTAGFERAYLKRTA